MDITLVKFHIQISNTSLNKYKARKRQDYWVYPMKNLLSQHKIEFFCFWRRKFKQNIKIYKEILKPKFLLLIQLMNSTNSTAY